MPSTAVAPGVISLHCFTLGVPWVLSLCKIQGYHFVSGVTTVAMALQSPLRSHRVYSSVTQSHCRDGRCELRCVAPAECCRIPCVTTPVVSRVTPRIPVCNACRVTLRSLPWLPAVSEGAQRSGFCTLSTAASCSRPNSRNSRFFSLLHHTETCTWTIASCSPRLFSCQFSK